MTTIAEFTVYITETLQAFIQFWSLSDRLCDPLSELKSTRKPATANETNETKRLKPKIQEISENTHIGFAGTLVGYQASGVLILWELHYQILS